MAMFNDLFQLLADVPPMLAAAWVVWLGAGALLMMWYRRTKLDPAFPAPAPRPAPRPKPASRPASSPDVHSDQAAATEAPVREHAKAPVVIGDPFGDLATLLDQPAPAAAAPTQPAAPAPTEPRAPADSPILSSSGSPLRPQIHHRPPSAVTD